MEKSTQIIAVHVRKGGGTKTSIAMELAYASASAGRSVLLIDTDSLASATILFGHEPTGAIRNWLVDDSPIENVVIEAKCDHAWLNDDTVFAKMWKRIDGERNNLYLLPGDEDSALIVEDLEIQSRRAKAVSDIEYINGVVKSRFDALRELSFDVIIVDTASERTKLNDAILRASDKVVIPASLEFMEQSACAMTVQLMEGIAPNTPYWIVPNKFDTEQPLHPQRLAQLQKDVAVDHLLWSGDGEALCIPYSKLVERARGLQVSTLEFVDHNPMYRQTNIARALNQLAQLVYEK